jgi:hypothetical protein
MGTTADLITVLKSELKAARITYAVLAKRMGMAESSIKRIFAKGDMPLSRVDQVCRALKLDFAEVARQTANQQPLCEQHTVDQERAVVSNPKLLLAAMSCLSQWTFEQIVSTYRISEIECIRLFARLDKLGIIELRPLNRYRVHVAKTFRWLPNGPVVEYFRQHVVDEYFSGAFDGEGELLTVVLGAINPAMASLFKERLRNLAQDFAQEHLTERRLPEEQRQPFTLLVSMRSWWFTAFQNLKR